MEDKFFLYFGLAVISVPTYLLIAKLLFGNLARFKDCIGSMSVEGIQTWPDVKFAYFVGLCAMAVYGEAAILLKFFPSIAKAIHGCAEWIIL